MKKAFSARHAYWLVMGMAVFFCGTVGAAVTPQQVATRLRNRIASAWKPVNLRISVVPYPNNADIEKGAFRHIGFSADSIEIDGVRITQVRGGAYDPVLDLDKLTRLNKIVLLRRRSTYIYGRVTERELNKALTYKKNTIENLRVKVGQGTVSFTGTFKFGLSTNLFLEGRLEVPDGYKINFVPTKASVGGLPLPAAPLRTVLNRINPLLDFHKVMFSPQIKRLEVKPGCITLIG